MKNEKTKKYGYGDSRDDYIWLVKDCFNHYYIFFHKPTYEDGLWQIKNNKDRILENSTSNGYNQYFKKYGLRPNKAIYGHEVEYLKDMFGKLPTAKQVKKYRIKLYSCTTFTITEKNNTE